MGRPTAIDLTDLSKVKDPLAKDKKKPLEVNKTFDKVNKFAGEINKGFTQFNKLVENMLATKDLLKSKGINLLPKGIFGKKEEKKEITHQPPKQEVTGEYEPAIKTVPTPKSDDSLKSPTQPSEEVIRQTTEEIKEEILGKEKRAEELFDKLIALAEQHKAKLKVVTGWTALLFIKEGKEKIIKEMVKYIK